MSEDAAQDACLRQRDGCAVETVALAPIIQDFVDRWEREHSELAARDRGYGSVGTRRNALGQLAGNDSFSAVRILHERTVRLDRRARRGVSEKTIRRVLERGTRMTELRTADALLTAIQRVEVFHDGTVSVVPNPNAAPSARAACCGGSSLNGSLGF